MPQVLVPDADVNNPGAFRREIKRTATAQAGGASTITLDTGASTADDFYNTDFVTLTAGTGAGQTRTISDYVGSTKVATVSVAWSTQPDSTSVFEIRESVLWEGLDSNLATYVESYEAPSNAAFRVGLSGGVDPLSTSQHRLYATMWKDPSGGARIDWELELYGGGGLIADQTFVDVPSTPTENFMELSVAEINLILQADYEGTLEVNAICNQVNT